jgi:hypothetical protein
MALGVRKKAFLFAALRIENRGEDASSHLRGWQSPFRVKWYEK